MSAATAEAPGRDVEIRVGLNLDPAHGLPSLVEGSVDVFITDPPYSRHVHECSRRGVVALDRERCPETAARRNRDLGFDHLSPTERAAVARQLARLVRRWALVFTDVEGVPGWRSALKAAGLEFVRVLFWLKEGATPQLTGDRPAAHAEAIVAVHQTRPRRCRSGRGGRNHLRSDREPVRKRWNGGGRGNLYRAPIVLDRNGSGGRYHPTQKPLALMRQLVDDFSDPGELVCDPYAGSGTTGLACRLAGRRFLGWERDPAWAEIARRRLAGEEPVPNPNQLDLFNEPRA